MQVSMEYKIGDTTWLIYKNRATKVVITKVWYECHSDGKEYRIYGTELGNGLTFEFHERDTFPSKESLMEYVSKEQDYTAIKN